MITRNTGNCCAASQTRIESDAPGFYSKQQVCDLTTLSFTTIWRLIQIGQFPPPVRLSRSRVAWPRATVIDWMRKKTESGEIADAVKLGEPSDNEVCHDR